MAEVLHAQQHFSSSGLRRSRPSQPQLYIPQSSPSTSSSSSSSSRPRKSDKKGENAAPSKLKRSLSSPSRLDTVEIHQKSKSSSKDRIRKDSEVHDPPTETIVAQYTTLPYKIDEEGNDAPPSSPLSSGDTPRAILSVMHSLSHGPGMAEDDTAVKPEPTRHVDYLSHDWKEEDIWSSWRHIVSQRKLYGEKSRLENASWRTWAKQQNRLKTVHPQNLNWMKDCDVTWLYGPLQPADKTMSQQTSEPASNLSKNNSFLNKKPILKKRSVSEMMLQKSLSNSSLIRQAAQAVQAQQRKPYDELLRRASDYTVDTVWSRGTSREGTDYFSSQSTSGFHSPAPEHMERRHIRFANKVEQCIAVDVKEGEEEEDEIDVSIDDDSSEDGLLMMKQTRKRRPNLKKERRNSIADSKIIAKLPSTTLKDRLESPNPESHSLGPSSFWKPRLSPSPSSETLRPSHPSKNFLIEDDSQEDDSQDEDEQMGKFVHDELESESDKKSDPDHIDERSSGLRRTESGMFMPVEEGEDPAFGGVVGKVLDTVNTARDIAHVIWNVGWRR